MREQREIDPLTLSIIEGRLHSMNQELGNRLFRQCFSFATSHIRDLGTTLFDHKERTVTIGNWMPVHTAGSDICLKGMLDWIGRDHIRPDDFILANDPFIVKFGHAPDWSLVRPIFYRGELLFYHFMRTHVFDSGGAFMGCYYPRTYDCHGEGLMIPPVKIIEEGKVDEKAYSIILRNVRGREMVRADNMLAYKAMRKSEERVIELLDTYGKDTVMAACDEIIERTREEIKEIISGWPRGVYKAERAADWDGTTDKPVWVRLSLMVKPDEGKLVFDFTDSDRQCDFINVPLGQTCAAVIIALAWSLPEGTRRNQGLMDCVEIITKEGTVLGPVYPATTGAQAPTLGTQIIECAQLTLAQIVPHDTSALWSRHLSPIISGNNRAVIDPRTKSPQLYWTSPFHGDGSDGAIYGFDGHDGLGPAHGGGAVVRSPVEVEEWLIPYRWLHYEFLTDSAGDGQWRGGLGTEVQVLNTYDPALWQSHDCVCMTGNSDGEKFTNTGLLGGTDGIANALGIIRRGEDVALRCCDNQYLQPGDMVWTKSGGGGGVGEPLDRAVEKVVLDARNEYISIEKARNVYGVAIDPDTFEVDEDATRELRQKGKE